MGAGTRVQFEAGDPDPPILAGGRWSAGQPPVPGRPEVKVLETDCVTITLSDLPGDGGPVVEVGPSAVAGQVAERDRHAVR
ncbi:hypothetical protein GTR00_01305, partial [Kineococcus sp. T90]